MTAFKKSIFLVFSLALFSPVHAQSLDSTAIWDTLNYSLRIVYATPDDAMELVELAQSSAESLGNESLIARSYNFLGIVYDVKGMRPEALGAYGIARAKADSLSDTRLYASAVNNIGLIQWQQGDYRNAVINFQESLTLFEEIDAPKGVANTLNNIGLIYTEQDRLEEALEYFMRAFKAYQNIDDMYGESAALMNIGRAYEQGDVLDSARKYMYLTLNLKRELNDPRGISMSYANLGVIAEKAGSLDSGIFYFEKALELDQENGFTSIMAQHMSALGNMYLKQGREEETEAILLDGLNYAEELGDLKTLWGIHYRLSELYAGQEQWQKAYYHSVQYTVEYQNWRDEEKEQEIINLQERFDVAIKDAELAEERRDSAIAAAKLREQNATIVIISGVAVLILILAIFLVRRLRARQRRLAEEHALKEQLSATSHEAEMDEQRKGISRDLHDSIGSQLTFLSSTLKNLTWALRNQSRPTEQTLDRLEEVSGYAQKTVSDLRDTVWAMNRDEMTVGEIMLRTENSVNQYREAFEGIRVDFETKGDEFDLLPAKKAMAVYRILQESLSNIRKHSGATQVGIVAERTNESWKWTVSDNGRGFDLSKVAKGSGLENLKERAANADMICTIESSIGKGTQIHLTSA